MYNIFKLRDKGSTRKISKKIKNILKSVDKIFNMMYNYLNKRKEADRK